MIRRTIVLACAVSLCCVFTHLAYAASDSKKTDSPKTEQRTESTTGKSRRHRSVEEKRLSAPSAEKPATDAKTATSDKRTTAPAKQPAAVEPKKTNAPAKSSVAADQKKSDASAKKSVAAEQKSGKPVEKKSVVAATKPAGEKPLLVRLTLKGDFPESAPTPGMFSELQPSLASIIERMDAAAADPNVRAVWLRIEDLNIGRGKVCELRGAVDRLRKAKKPVFAELTTADGSQYLIASACSWVVMPPSGMLVIPGVRAEMLFYKGLFDKVGLKFDSLQMGKYKGAAEPLTRTDMSPALRESLEALVDDAYDDLVTTIGNDRKMKDYKVKTLLDQGLFTAATARKAGLIDDVVYADQLHDDILKSVGCKDLELVTTYKKKRINTDFSGFSGLMKMFEMMMGGKPSKPVSQKQKIAVVYAVGTIVEGTSKNDMFNDNSSLGSTTLITALKKAIDDPTVAAVVLRIDSPGGSATASDLIWRETVRSKKPMIASMGDVAGSGGYYIAMGAKKIIASPGTLTGSIGVIGGKLVVGGLYQKLGLTTDVISRGSNSGALSSTQPFTPDERRAWTEVLEETYRQFVGKAAEGRKMPVEKLEQLAQGRVYTGRMAKKLGLVDQLGTLSDAVTAAKLAAGLTSDADVELMVLPEPKTFFEQLFGDPSASTDLESLLPEGFALLRQTQLFRQLLSERVLLWMPYSVQVK
ncbi:MAG: signal peptide peptidase SppA [Thermoguttaceae bacterium]